MSVSSCKAITICNIFYQGFSLHVAGPIAPQDFFTVRFFLFIYFYFLHPRQNERFTKTQDFYSYSDKNILIDPQFKLNCKIKIKKKTFFSIFVKCPGILQYYKYWYTFTVNKKNVIYIYIYLYTKTPSPKNQYTHSHYGIQRNFISKFGKKKILVCLKHTYTQILFYPCTCFNTVNVFLRQSALNSFFLSFCCS